MRQRETHRDREGEGERGGERREGERGERGRERDTQRQEVRVRELERENLIVTCTPAWEQRKKSNSLG